MSFYKRYELARLIQEGDAKTFSAVEIATGRPILLHMLTPSVAMPMASVREIVARAERNPQVLEVGEIAGSYYIASATVDGFQSFRKWVDSLPPAAAVEPSRPAPPAAVRPAPAPTPPAEPPSEFGQVFGPKAKSGDGEPGEFTQLFYGKTLGKPAQAVPPLPRSPADTGGEFTRLFGGDRDDTPRSTERSRAAERSRSEDEFKPVFDAPLSEPEDAPPVPAANPAPPWQEAIQKQAPPNKPGSVREDHSSEYTKFFGNSLPSEPVDIPAEQARQAGMVEPKEKPFRQASDFTRVFGPGGNPGQAQVVPNYPPGGQSVSKMFEASDVPIMAPKAPGPVQNIFANAPSAADDYAKVVGARGMDPMSGFAAQQQQPPPPPVKKNIGLIIVLLLAGGLFMSLVVWGIFAIGSK